MDPTIAAILDRAGAAPDDGIDLAETALALAALDRPRVALDWYRRHLDQLVADVAETGAPTAAEALATVVAERWGYQGDTQTYDDLQNANLMRVIDRRKGLPVALGILYIHVARARGWASIGLSFPSHFLIRVDAEGERAIVDPFHGGMVRGPGELRELLKAVVGIAAELAPEHYAPLGDRDVLLRLQNNIKLRHLQSGALDRAIAVLDGMRRIAPKRPLLWRETGMLQARLGNLRAAIETLERFLALGGTEVQRHETAVLLQALKSRLN